MPEATVKRTLVKSPPELWAEISDTEALARHLGEFGEIRITRTTPETTVAWEGDRARGTVEIEAAGWGTKVTLTAETLDAVIAEEQPPEPVAVVPEPEPAVEPEPEPVAVAPAPEPVVEPEQAPELTAEPVAASPEPAAKKPGFFARLFGRKPKAAAAAQPVVEPVEPASEDAPPHDPAPALAPVPEPEPELAPVVPLTPPVEPDPAPPAAAEAGQTVPAIDSERATEILTVVLDDLGAAHHRPFSRS